MKDQAIGTTSQKAPKTTARMLLNTLTLLVLLVISSSVTTQYVAHEFQYHSSLSGHIASYIYQPFSWMLWAFEWWATYPAVFEKGLAVFTFGCAFSVLIYVFVIIASSRKSRGVKDLHGSSHWATKKEIKKSGFLKKNKKGTALDGVLVGSWKDAKKNLHYLRHNGPEHVLAFAPTRSGKGVGLVLPTLLSWLGSVFCYDEKGENWALTSGWRRKYAGNKVMKFEPASKADDGVSFNPLEEIRLGEDEEIGDTQLISEMIVDPEGKGLHDHWTKTSNALLTGVILHCCYEKRNEENRPANLKDVADFLSDPDRSTMETLEHMLNYEHIREGSERRTHEVVAQEARSMLNKDERELSSVVSTAVSFLTLYRDPIVAKNTIRSDFKIHDLMNNDHPVSLYFVVSPRDAPRLRPLTRLVITLIVRRQMGRMEFYDGRSVAHYKHRLLLMLDEFASLKKLPAIADGLANMAGYGLKAYVIVQDLQQILSIYGKEEALTGNCHVRIAYAPNRVETAELLSKMTGPTTVEKSQITVSGKRFSHVLGNVSETIQEVQRPLLTVDETMRLPSAVVENNKITHAGHMLIFVAGQAPIYGRQILYFRDECFLARAKVPTPQRSDKIQIHVDDRKARLFEKLA